MENRGVLWFRFSPDRNGFLGLVLHTSTGAALRTDLAGSRQSHPGQGGAYQLIHQHREQHHVPDHVSVGKLGSLCGHAQATPAWGSRVMPRYFWMLGLHLVARQLA